MKSALCVLLVLLAGSPVERALVAQGQPQEEPGRASAQIPEPLAPLSMPTGTTFRSATELVALNVTVTDGHDRFVKGLAKENFAVFEDGVPQDVSFFASYDVPVDLAIMLDASASMADKMSIVREAAAGFVRTLRPGDRAEVLSFANDTRVLAPFTDERSKLESAIMSATPRGSTALYTSIYVALQDLVRLNRREGGVRRPALVVLTDGDDTASMLGFDDILDAAKRSNVTVYAISIVSKTDPTRFMNDGSPRVHTQGDYALRSLTQETGGRVFFPVELRDLNGVYERIAEELSSQYSLAYAPKSHGDGSYRRLFVRVLGRDDVRPRTRTGYYAAKTVRAAAGAR